MEYMFKKYGVKVFVLDNLMCVDFSDYPDEWVAQKKFILDLLKFTVKYKTYTHLVAHPKKPDGKGSRSVYDLYGTSTLSNLTHRLLWVTKDEKGDKDYDSMITILKDRPTGIGYKKVKLFYNPKTMRLISNQEELDKKYSWEENFKPKYSDYIEKRLVCNNDSEDEVFGK